MYQILKAGSQVQTVFSKIPCQVEKLLGSGGQGEVYQANLSNHPVALKWYYPQYLQQDVNLRKRLEKAIKSGAPNDRFLWPMDIVTSSEVSGFGYIMPLRDQQYKSTLDWVDRKIKTSIKALTTLGLELAESFSKLHAEGLCYRDISFGNVFFNPNTGHILICDNDNVSINNSADVIIQGTMKFMAPEVMRNEALPNTQTDLYSLAVLLFYLFILHHPLDGKKEACLPCLDQSAMQKLYGTEPVFIYDPDDDSNRPVPGDQQNAIDCWAIYPKFFQNVFTQAFTEGIKDPLHGRVTESVWRKTMVRLRDSVVYCPHCRAENFYDVQTSASSENKPNCWSCHNSIQLPPHIEIDNQIIMLNTDAELFPHHINPQKSFDFSQPVAQMNQHPTKPNVWGLKNLTNNNWTITSADGKTRDIKPGKSVPLALGTKIDFGTTQGEIKS
jgi:serine/threonine protein kinase